MSAGMEVRHVHNTAGEYAAFIAGGHLFTPGCRWLGVVQRERVYNCRGLEVGRLDPEGRLLRDRSARACQQILLPTAPMRPSRPLPPKRRLFLRAASYPLEDVFQGLRRPLTALPTVLEIEAIHALEGCALVAADGAVLGCISRDPGVPRSLADPAGPWGDPEAGTSVCNPAGVYGSEASPLSPFHPATDVPPRIERDGATVGFLSVDPAHPDRVDPNALVAWLAAV